MLWHVEIETTYRDSKTGGRRGRGHTLHLQAETLELAVTDTVRFVRNRQESEKVVEEMCRKDGTLADYEANWGELGCIKISPFYPVEVNPQGNIDIDYNYEDSGDGYFEWKRDRGPIEAAIAQIKERKRK